MEVSPSSISCGDLYMTHMYGRNSMEHLFHDRMSLFHDRMSLTVLAFKKKRPAQQRKEGMAGLPSIQFTKVEQ